MREKQNQVHMDSFAAVLAICYVTVPIMIFMFGWLKPVYAIIGSIFMLGLGISVVKALIGDDAGKSKWNVSRKNMFLFWIGVVIAAAIWVYLSGIGSMVYQNSDYWVRNPIFRDLSTCSWPVIFDLSQESEAVQSICGSGTAAFSYYFCWWLPVSAIAKLFGLGEAARNLLLNFWALLGVLLVIYFLCRKMKKCSWIIPVVMIIFSGLDVLPYLMRTLIMEKSLHWNFLTSHMEWWASFFQYSSNTTQLFWVFNQSIPVWVIMSIIIQLADAKYIAGMASLTFAYSPWATFGIIPYAIYASFKGKKELKSAINFFNAAVPIWMLVIFGTFYAASTGSEGYIGLIFMQYPDKKAIILCTYVLFLFVEFGIYFLLMGKTAVHYEYFGVTLAELVIFPLFVIRDSNFVMRGSIPALFILMFYIMKYLIENKPDKESQTMRRRKYMLILALCCGMMTPLTEINRTVVNTISSGTILQEQIGSFGDMQTEDDYYIRTAKAQFFVYDYENTIFFKYLSK
jgi:hypothetical protein